LDVFTVDTWSFIYTRAAGALDVFTVDTWSFIYTRAAGGSEVLSAVRAVAYKW